MPKSAPSQAEVIGHREADGWVVTDRGHCGLEKAELQIRVSRSEQPWDWVRPWTAAVWNPQGTGKRTPGPVPPSGTWTRWSFARTANAARSAGIRSWGSAATPRCQPTAASWTCWRTRPGHPPGKGCADMACDTSSRLRVPLCWGGGRHSEGHGGGAGVLQPLPGVQGPREWTPV